MIFKNRAVLPSIVLLLGAAPATAQNSGQVFADPPTLRDRGAIRPLLESVSPGAPPAPTGRRDFDLTVAYTDNKIWNPATQRFDKVHLRSYTGEGVNPDAPFVAPKIEVRPGQTISMTLHDKLPADPSCTAQHSDPNDPHCFNGTNLHSHGLWISPSGNSDNVLLSINPGVDFEYIYNLPPDHPAGTFWYHSHRHGSTALQVSSGIGFRKKKPSAPAITALTAVQAASFIEENCTGELLSYQQIATDGLTMRQALPTPTSTLQPGYRYDALVVFPEAGDYCVVNESAPGSGSVSREAVTRQLLGVVQVGAGTPVTNSTALLEDLLSSVPLQTLPPGEAIPSTSTSIRSRSSPSPTRPARMSAFVARSTMAAAKPLAIRNIPGCRARGRIRCG
jgi:FtsP/CotA-like multicopper oxidase with cupredoxin domain